MTNDELKPDVSPLSGTERAAAAGQFALALAGGFPGIAGYMLARIEKRRNAEIREYVHAIAGRLEAVEDRIIRDDPLVESDIEEIVEKAWDRKQREKREFWAAAAAHIAANDVPDAVERKRMIDTLDRVRLSHLRLLRLVALEEPPAGFGGGNMDAYVSFGIPGLDIAVARLDWADLEAAGILSNYPTGMTAARHWDLARQGITPFGRRFIAFVEA